MANNDHKPNREILTSNVNKKIKQRNLYKQSTRTISHPPSLPPSSTTRESSLKRFFGAILTLSCRGAGSGCCKLPGTVERS